MIKRVAIFAHYDKDCVIDDYVLFYVKELKKVCDHLVFVSACDLTDDETFKLNGIADKIIAQRHDEYDFGSYKRGFEFVRYNIINDIDFNELIFANDSCYGPLFPLSEVFDKMDKKPCDFWGITENKYGIKGKARHIQSYFMVFKKNIFTSNLFVDFMQNIKHEECKNDIIIKYEIGLSQMLLKNGFVAESYVEKYRNLGNSTIYKWRELLEKKLSPFIKCSVLRLENTNMTTIQNWENCFKNLNYDNKLIENNLKSHNIRKINKKIPLFLKKMFFNFVLCLPNFVRKPFIEIKRKFCPFIFD